MPLTDEELMAAYADGDLEAFHALYERHKGRILGFLVSRLRDRDEAEEVFQAVFVKLHSARKRYRPEIAFLPWIFTLTRNILIDHVRRNRTYRRFVQTSELPEIPAAERSPILPVAKALPEIRALSAAQRQALELRFDQDFSFEEIAARMRISAANSRQLISRAVRRLRNILADKGVH